MQPAGGGQTLHGDHAYVFYQVPVDARKLPLVMWHGFGQFGEDLGDHARRPRRLPEHLPAAPLFGLRGRSAAARRRGARHGSRCHQRRARRPALFNTFRLGRLAGLLPRRAVLARPGGAEPVLPPDGARHRAVRREGGDRRGLGAVRQDRPGCAGHPFAQRGAGLAVGDEEPNVRAIVSYEPGSGFSFRKARCHRRCPLRPARSRASAVPLAEFCADSDPDRHLLRRQHSGAAQRAPGEDNWRVRLAMARLWSDAVNRHGGDVTLVHLPEIGIRGNTHFPFSDLNNVQIADLMSDFLNKKGSTTEALMSPSTQQAEQGDAICVLDHSLPFSLQRFYFLALGAQKELLVPLNHPSIVPQPVGGGADVLARALAPNSTSAGAPRSSSRTGSGVNLDWRNAVAKGPADGAVLPSATSSLLTAVNDAKGLASTSARTSTAVAMASKAHGHWPST